MWNYAEFSQLAKAFGGPEQLVNYLTERGIEIGIKKAKGKNGLYLGIGIVSGSVLTGLSILAVLHFSKGKNPALESKDAAAKVLVDEIKAYDEETSENPNIVPLPDITREEAEAMIDHYVRDVADGLK